MTICVCFVHSHIPASRAVPSTHGKLNSFPRVNYFYPILVPFTPLFPPFPSLGTPLS